MWPFFYVYALSKTAPAAFVLAGAAAWCTLRRWRKPGRRDRGRQVFLLFCLGWLGPFSIAQSVSRTYLLPATPCVCILAGGMLSLLLRARSVRALANVAGWVALNMVWWQSNRAAHWLEAALQGRWDLAPAVMLRAFWQLAAGALAAFALRTALLKKAGSRPKLVAGVLLVLLLLPSLLWTTDHVFNGSTTWRRIRRELAGHRCVGIVVVRYHSSPAQTFYADGAMLGWHGRKAKQIEVAKGHAIRPQDVLHVLRLVQDGWAVVIDLKKLAPEQFDPLVRALDEAKVPRRCGKGFIVFLPLEERGPAMS